jgi:hypothetical protein
MQKEPKHHYIPCFYSQQWANKDGELIEYCRRYKGVEARPTAPDGTGYVRGLYKLPDAPSGEEYVVETELMSSIDNWAAQALQRMLEDGAGPGKLDAQRALGWCQFLYSLIVRNPEHLQLIKESWTPLRLLRAFETIIQKYAVRATRRASMSTRRLSL